MRIEEEMKRLNQHYDILLKAFCSSESREFSPLIINYCSEGRENSIAIAVTWIIKKDYGTGTLSWPRAAMI
jgi:hypothetical protein